VDYENVYWADKRSFSDEGQIEKLARDLAVVAEDCGPLTMRKVYAPFDKFPQAMAVFTNAGYDAVTCGEKTNAADLKLIADLVAITTSQDVGLVFLVSGDGDMLDAVEHAQKQGARVVVVSSSGRELAATTKAAADKVVVLPEIHAEAKRIRNGKSRKLNLVRLVEPAQATASGHCATGEDAASPGETSPGEVRSPSGAARPITMSPSALKTYVQCPRRYYLSYVEGRQEKPSKHIFIGTVVHQALKDFFSSGPRERSWQALEEALRTAWARSPERRELFPDRNEEAGVGRGVLADLKAFFKKVDRRVVPFGLEVFLRTRVGDGVHVRGRVDRIDEDPETGSLTVIDYKTGKVPAQKPNLIDHFQLPLYHAMVDEAYSRTVDKVILYYLKGNVTFEYSLEPDDIERAKGKAYELAVRAAGDKDHAPRVSPLCRFCSFLDECPSRAEVERRYLQPAREPESDLSDLPF